MQRYNEIKEGKQMNKETKLRIRNITAKAALKIWKWSLGTEERRGTTFRSSTDEIFLRHLLGITKLDKEKKQCIRPKSGSTEHSKGNKTVLEKVATIRTEGGHK